jgi:hypothetical protein
MNGKRRVVQRFQDLNVLNPRFVECVATRDLTIAVLMSRLCEGPPTNLDFLRHRAHLLATRRHEKRRRNDLDDKTIGFGDIHDGVGCDFGQAYAGTTISDKRYWPREARLSSETVVRQPKNAFGAATAPSTETAGRRYNGGPKSAN